MSKRETHWRKEHRATGVEFRCQDGGEVYLSFKWNGTTVWEYVGTAGERNAKAFAKYLREMADKMEQRLPLSEGESHG